MGDQKQYVVAPALGGASRQALTDMNTCIVVDGFPKARADIVPKLYKITSQLFQKLGVGPKFWEMPIDEMAGGQGLGYAFLEYPTREEADNAVATLHDKPFDKEHRLKANVWADFDTYMEAPDEYEQPTTEEISSSMTAIDNPYAWLGDPTGREQYLVKSGAEYNVQVHWHDPHMTSKRETILAAANAPKEWTVLDRSRHRVQKDFPCWSPQGTYIVSMEASGVRLWAASNDTWQTVVRFDHPKITKFHFSPRERYCYTACNLKCCLWDVRLGKLLKTFSLGPEDKQWPLFQWSSDETLFTQQKRAKDPKEKDGPERENIIVWSTATLTERRIPFDKDDTVQLRWSPASPYLVYSVMAASADKPVKIFVDQFAADGTSKEAALRTVYGVLGTQILWQPKGNYCSCVMQQGVTKPDKIDLFRVSGGKDIGIEQLEVTGEVQSVTWDPSALYGARFCVVSTMKKGVKKTQNQITFYHATAGNIRTIKVLTDKTATCVQWASSSTHAVAKDDRGVLEFLAIESDNVSVLQVQEHPGSHTGEWDPSGRYFVTSISVQKTEIDNGYRIYNFLGQLVFYQDLEKFSHLAWRPRPPTPLTTQECQQILKTLGKRMAKYEQEENERRARDLEETRRMEEEVAAKFAAAINDIRRARAADTKKRNEIRAEQLLAAGIAPYTESKRTREVVISSRDEFL